MKEELINSIICMLMEHGIQIDGIQSQLHLLMQNYEITQAETALTVVNETLNENLIKRFLAAKIVKGCSPNTIVAYQGNLVRAFEKINKNVPDITADDVRVYLAYRMLNDGVTKITADNELRSLKSFFNFLSGEGLVPKNPTVNVDKVKAGKNQKKAFSEMECEMIRSSCRTAMESAIVELLFSTACRALELVQIKISEIHGDKIIVHGKGNKDRTVYMTAKAQLAVQTYLAERKDSNPYLFPKSKEATQLEGKKQYWYQKPKYVEKDGHKGTSGLQSLISNIGKRAGIENCHPHRFRRTCATLALRRGMPIEQVSKMLGHEQIATTQIYLDTAEEELMQAHRKYVT